MRDFKITQRITESSDNISRYFNEVSKQKVLTPQEESELAFLAKKGDSKAKDQIIRSNLKFVISVAKSYSGYSIPLSDLISEGNKGLVEAIEFFNPETGFKFISYAIWHIRKNILLYLSENTRQIKIPINVITEIRKYQKIEDEFSSMHGRSPSFDEVYEIIKESGDKELSNGAINMIKNEVSTVPLSNPDNDGESSFSPIDYLNSGEDTDYYINSLGDSKILGIAFKSLTPIERECLKMKYGINEERTEYSYLQIAEKFSKSREWARMLVKKAERRIKLIITRSKSLSDELSIRI